MRCSKNGFPATGAIGLGIWYVSGLSLVPLPPARMTACIECPSFCSGKSGLKFTMF